MIIVILAVAAFAVLTWLKRPNIKSDDARKLVSEGAALVDVRSPAEFASGHLDRARNVPVGEIGRRAGELGAHDRPIIVYCASGARSAMAARTLKGAGFQRVYNLGAMSNWH